MQLNAHHPKHLQWAKDSAQWQSTCPTFAKLSSSTNTIKGKKTKQQKKAFNVSSCQPNEENLLLTFFYKIPIPLQTFLPLNKPILSTLPLAGNTDRPLPTFFSQCSCPKLLALWSLFWGFCFFQMPLYFPHEHFRGITIYILWWCI